MAFDLEFYEQQNDYQDQRQKKDFRLKKAEALFLF